MATLATTQDVERRLEKTLEGEQVLLVTSLLEEASALVRLVLGASWDRPHAYVRGLVTDMVVRAINASPEAKAGFQQVTTGPYSASVAAEFIGGFITLTDRERELLEEVVRQTQGSRFRIGTVVVGSWYG